MKWLKLLWQKLFHKSKNDWKKVSMIGVDPGLTIDDEDDEFDRRYPGAREFHEDCGDR